MSSLPGRRKRFICALFLAVVAGGSSAASAQERPPYELNAIVSVTGPGAFVGAPVAQSFKIIESYVNRTGGIKGRPIQINVLDDQSNPQVSVQLANGLVAKKAAVFMGPMLTASCSAVVPLLAHGPVAYCSSPFVDSPANGFMFTQGGSALDFAIVSLRYLKERGLRRIAMLNATDGTGQATDKALEQAFGFNEFKDMHLVAHYRFAPTDVSVAAQVAQIKAIDPQALITLSIGPPFGTVMRNVYDAGLSKLPMIATGANASEGQMRAIASVMPTDVHFVFGASWVADARVPKPVQGEIDSFRRVMATGGATSDGAHAAFWDPTLVVIHALRQLPADPTAEQVRSYIATLHGFAGANGFYDFRFGSQSGAGPTIYLLGHWDPGKQQFVASSLPGGHVIR
jgi:branched-chain amino acid transport system substrate-binding protein